MVRRRCLAVPVEVRRIARLSRVAGTERTNRLISIFIWIFRTNPLWRRNPTLGSCGLLVALCYIGAFGNSSQPFARQRQPWRGGTCRKLMATGRRSRLAFLYLMPGASGRVVGPERIATDLARHKDPIHYGGRPVRLLAASKPSLTNFSTHLMLWLARSVYKIIICMLHLGNP